MRILVVAPQYPPALGGVERHVAELTRGLLSHGFPVEVAATDPGLRSSEHFIDSGVPVHRFPTILKDGVYFVSPSLGRWVLGEAQRFDLVHGHSYHTPNALVALVGARRHNIPFVLTPHYHGTGHSPFRRLLHVPYRHMGRRLVRASRPIICVSRAEADLLRDDFGISDVVIAPNGIDVDAIATAEPFHRQRDEQVVLASGRLHAYKQVDHLVEAIALLPDSTRLIVTGSGPEENRIRARAQELGVSDRVTLLGVLSTAELHRWLRTADVFASLSTNEAFGIGLLEAIVGGAAVVASDIPAHLEVADYTPGSRIRFVPPHAEPEQVAEAIEAARRPVVPADLSRVPRWTDTVEATIVAYEAARQRAGRHRLG